MLIPALDLIDGHIVRLKQGDFNEKTVFDLDPVAKVCEYAADGAALIHIVDLDGAKDPQRRQVELISQMVKASSCPIQTGGGIRTYEDVKTLLDLGVKRVVVGSAAVKDREFGKKLLRDFGAEAICLALDVRIEDGVAKVATHGWLETSELTLEQLIDEFMPEGLAHVLVTDIAKDGMMQGANNSLYASLAQKYPQLDVIASGGISCLDDIKALKNLKATSCVLGRSLLTGAFNLKEALTLWPNDATA